MYSLLEKVDFHCHVSLLEGISHSFLSLKTLPCFFEQTHVASSQPSRPENCWEDLST